MSLIVDTCLVRTAVVETPGPSTTGVRQVLKESAVDLVVAFENDG